MPVFVSMLRGVNVGAHNRIKMDALRAVYESLQLEDVRTYVQSGNVIFRTKQRNPSDLSRKIQSAIESAFGFRPAVVVRTPAELRQAIKANPFPKHVASEPAKVLITFLADEPATEAADEFRNLKGHPEELHLKGRDLFIYFPDGVGKTKLPWSTLDRLLQTTGTARNWNTVRKMLEMAEELEAGKK